MKGSPDLYQLPMELSYMKLHRQEEKFSDLYQLPAQYEGTADCVKLAQGTVVE